MADYSKSVKRGLERMHSAEGEHPDADLLAAFAEQSLTKGERESVLAHLAGCAVCRDVVSLAVPDSHGVLQHQPEPAKPLLWRWPVLRWGAVAASVIVVAIAVSIGNIEHNAEKQQSAQTRTDAAPMPGGRATGSGSEPAREANPPEVQLPVSSGMQRQKIRYEKVPDSSAKAASAEAKDNRDRRNPAGELIAHDEVRQVPAEESKASGAAVDQNAAGAMVAGIPAKAVVVPPPPPRVAANAAPVSSGQAVRVQGESAMLHAPSSDAAVTTAEVRAKKEAAPQAPPVMYQANAQDSVRKQDSLRKMMRFAAPTNWNVTSGGVLQKSFDEGKTWEQALPNANFRAVATIGNEIWAGGANALLMHSSDGGQTWATVTPGMSGDVRSLEFRDAKHGLVKTSANEAWETSDGGKSWTKR